MVVTVTIMDSRLQSFLEHYHDVAGDRQNRRYGGRQAWHSALVRHCVTLHCHCPRHYPDTVWHCVAALAPPAPAVTVALSFAPAPLGNIDRDLCKLWLGQNRLKLSESKWHLLSSYRQPPPSLCNDKNLYQCYCMNVGKLSNSTIRHIRSRLHHCSIGRIKIIKIIITIEKKSLLNKKAIAFQSGASLY